MTDILSSAQQAIIAALSANTEIQTLLGNPARIYDSVPQDAAMPYIAFGPASVEQADAKNATGFNIIVTLNAWSRYRGGKEIREIFGALYDALHRADIANITSCEFHSADFSTEDDGLTFLCTARFYLRAKD